MKNQLVYVLNSVTAKYTYMPSSILLLTSKIQSKLRSTLETLLLGQNNFFNELFVLL